jgi:hypothetical protein
MTLYLFTIHSTERGSTYVTLYLFRRSWQVIGVPAWAIGKRESLRPADKKMAGFTALSMGGAKPPGEKANT